MNPTSDDSMFRPWECVHEEGFKSWMDLLDVRSTLRKFVWIIYSPRGENHKEPFAVSEANRRPDTKYTNSIAILASVERK